MCSDDAMKLQDHRLRYDHLILKSELKHTMVILYILLSLRRCGSNLQRSVFTRVKDTVPKRQNSHRRNTKPNWWNKYETPLCVWCLVKSYISLAFNGWLNFPWSRDCRSVAKWHRQFSRRIERKWHDYVRNWTTSKSQFTIQKFCAFKSLSNILHEEWICYQNRSCE